MFCFHKWKIFEVICWRDLEKSVESKIGGKYVCVSYDTTPQDIYAKSVCLKCEKIKDEIAPAMTTYERAYRKEQKEQLEMKQILKAKGGL